MAEIEFWRSGDWTMVYKDGVLQRAGDHYHADEWLQAEVGVLVVDDDAGVSIPDGRNAVRLLSDVKRAEGERLDRLQAADRLRQEAAELLEQAKKLESIK